MSIPTVQDRAIGEIDQVNSCVLISLRTMQHAPPESREKLRRVLRERVIDYNEKVFAFADQAG